jgi:hypothetical protein
MSQETLTIRCPHDGCLKVFHIVPETEGQMEVLNSVLEKDESALSLLFWINCAACGKRFQRYGRNMVPCSCDLLIHVEEEQEPSPPAP